MASVDGIRRIPVLKKKVSKVTPGRAQKVNRLKISKRKTFISQERVYQQQLKSVKKTRGEKPLAKEKVSSGVRIFNAKIFGIIFFILAILVVFVLWGFSIKQNLQRITNTPKENDSTFQEAKEGVDEIIIDFQNSLDTLQTLLQQQKNSDSNQNLNSSLGQNQPVSNTNLNLSQEEQTLLEQKLLQELQKQINSNQNNNQNLNTNSPEI